MQFTLVRPLQRQVQTDKLCHQILRQTARISENNDVYCHLQVQENR